MEKNISAFFYINVSVPEGGCVLRTNNTLRRKKGKREAVYVGGMDRYQGHNALATVLPHLVSLL